MVTFKSYFIFSGNKWFFATGTLWIFYFTVKSYDVVRGLARFALFVGCEVAYEDNIVYLVKSPFLLS